MGTVFRTPYRYCMDELESIPFEGLGWENWMVKEARLRRWLVIQIMAWSYLSVATAFLSMPLWLLSGSGSFLALPLLPSSISLILIGTYKRTVSAVDLS